MFPQRLEYILKEEEIEYNIYLRPEQQFQFNSKTSHQNLINALSIPQQKNGLSKNKEFINNDNVKIQINRSILEDDSKSLPQHQFPIQLIKFLEARKQQNKQYMKAIKRPKNSNSIKKLGRIILNYLPKYHEIAGGKNIGVINMLQSMKLSQKKYEPMCVKRDRFNTYNFQILINCEDEVLRSKNLKMTHFLLKRHLRKEILKSKQITNINKIIYMNSLKSCELRCFCSTLCGRLQIPIKDV